MKKIYYILPIVLLVMNVLSGCTDSEEEQGPVVVEVDDEEMLRQGWKWAVALDNDLRMHVIWTKTHRKELQTKLRETS